MAGCCAGLPMPTVEVNDMFVRIWHDLTSVYCAEIIYALSEFCVFLLVIFMQGHNAES
jgi:hypothetical protein